MLGMRRLTPAVLCLFASLPLMAQQSFVTSFNSNLQNFTTGTPYVINDTQYTQAQNPINALPVDKTGAVNTTIWANPSNFHVECDVTQYNSGLGYAGYPAGTVLSPPPVTLDGVNGTPLVCGWFTVNVTSSPDGRLGGAGAAGNTEQANITIAVNKTAGTPGTMNVALWQLPTGAGGPGGGGDNGNTYTGRVRIIYEPAPAGPPGLTQINPAALQSMDVPIQVTVAREPLLITPGPSNCVDGTTNCFETIVGTGPGFAFQCGSVSVPLAEYGTESYDIALQSSSSGIYTGIGPTAFTSPDPSGGACGNGANCTGSWLNIIGNDSTSF
ncbi:MAG TPA: hypothetical protein VLX90_21550, partial [Steroidobacteraceae bacterium]|nr:hypothetical protein [Steroidobacteraceae bacterium]